MIPKVRILGAVLDSWNGFLSDENVKLEQTVTQSCNTQNTRRPFQTLLMLAVQIKWNIAVLQKGPVVPVTSCFLSYGLHPFCPFWPLTRDINKDLFIHGCSFHLTQKFATWPSSRTPPFPSNLCHTCVDYCNGILSGGYQECPGQAPVCAELNQQGSHPHQTLAAHHPTLIHLHWLQVKSQITYKILLLTTNPSILWLFSKSYTLPFPTPDCRPLGTELPAPKKLKTHLFN